MGYTREYPLHRRLLRIYALRAATGPERAHRAVLAQHLGLRP
jgi:alkylation response protein AidB-like acyl-CoA dehydrogenase